MPRPKILDVNEGAGEALFYSYNVLVNKCSGSCDTLDNPMAKLCVPNIIKRINMKVYSFLMRLNETRNVLWYESCKCVCKLNSSVCNNKQIWNSEYQKSMYKEILKKINKDINRNYVKIKFESNDNVPLNILVSINNSVLAVRYQIVYINTCQYEQFYEGIQV